MLLLIGSLGMLSLVDASTRNTYRAEQSQVVVNQLQPEMEKIKRIPFEEVAMTAAPTHSTDPSRPVVARVGQPVRDVAERHGPAPDGGQRRHAGGRRHGLRTGS